MLSKKIGFIGQGFIGKSYSDDFEARGYEVIRYSLDPEYFGNKDKIKNCDVVFIAVNAATKPLAGEIRDDGTPKTYFDDSNIKAVIPLTKESALIIIKSTLPPGKTKELQATYSNRKIFHSPEFLTETKAKVEAQKPLRNIVGLPEMSDDNIALAKQVLQMFPPSQYEKIMDSTEAELVKYGANAFLFVKVLFSNIFFEIVEKHNTNWDLIREAIGVDPRIGPYHMDLHLQGEPEGVYNRRGAGRSCFIKDMAHLSEIYSEELPNNKQTLAVLRAMEYKNAQSLRDFNRYVDVLESVYGKDAHK